MLTPNTAFIAKNHSPTLATRSSRPFYSSASLRLCVFALSAFLLTACSQPPKLYQDQFLAFGTVVSLSIRELDKQFGLNIAGQLMNTIEEKLSHAKTQSRKEKLL